MDADIVNPILARLYSCSMSGGGEADYATLKFFPLDIYNKDKTYYAIRYANEELICLKKNLRNCNTAC